MEEVIECENICRVEVVDVCASLVEFSSEWVIWICFSAEYS